MFKQNYAFYKNSMMLTTIIPLLFIVGIAVYEVEGSCFMQLPTRPFESPRCQYHNITIAPGTTYNDTEACFLCSCSKSGLLNCCGYGYAAGKIAPPVGCYILKNGCNYNIVNAQDHTQQCSLNILG